MLPYHARRRDTTPICLPTMLGGIPTLVYMPGYTLLGTPATVRHRIGYAADLRPCWVTKPWAQGGNIPWVRASREPQVLKGVREGVPLCAEFPALSGENSVKDWIDEGCIPVYSLRLG